MNIVSIIGLIISTVVLVTGLKLASDDISLFFDGPSLFIVLGGTFAATSVSFQLNRLGLLLKIFLTQFISGKGKKSAKLIKNIMQICESARSGEPYESLVGRAEDHFLKEGVQLIADGILESEQILNILEHRADQMAILRSEDTRKIKSLGKFPPAFGMMGTTIGMIVLLANLGGADAMKMIGPAMGVCLITTLYGVILANLFVIPVGENLEVSTRETEIQNKIILEGIKHILEKSNPILVAEDLNSFLLPKDRLDWKMN